MEFTKKEKEIIEKYKSEGEIFIVDLTVDNKILAAYLKTKSETIKLNKRVFKKLFEKKIFYGIKEDSLTYEKRKNKSIKVYRAKILDRILESF